MIKAALRLSTMALAALALLVGQAHATTVDVLDNMTSCTSVVSSATETEVYGFDIPGGTIDDSYRGVVNMRIFGTLINFTGATKQITYRIKVGGTVRYQQTFNVANMAVAKPVFLDLHLVKFGATDSNALLHGQYSEGVISSNPAVGFGVMIGAPNSGMVFRGTQSLDNFSSTQRLSVTVQFNAGVTDLSFSCNHGSVLKQ